MKFKSTIIALLIGLSLIGAACSKSGGGSAANMSDDDKYKLIYASVLTQDPTIIADVIRKLGFVNSDGTPNDSYKKFMEGGRDWGMKNMTFAQEVNTPEKAKEYVKSHMP
jgi:hypothetical protein